MSWTQTLHIRFLSILIVISLLCLTYSPLTASDTAVCYRPRPDVALLGRIHGGNDARERPSVDESNESVSVAESGTDWRSLYHDDQGNRFLIVNPLHN